MISNAQIRQKARQVLGGGIFKNEWLYALLVSLVVSVISGALSATFVGTIIVYGILMVASSTYYLGRVRGTVAHDKLGVTIEGVKNDLSGSLITGILYNVFIMLWSMLFVIPGIVKSCSYALTFYIRADNPSLSATEAITESRRMMDGYKMKYFMLQLSFIGWLIVGTLCLGVGTLWVAAYMQTATAVFYEEVKAAKCPQANAAPEAEAAESAE